jgi:hypothetical protein
LRLEQLIDDGDLAAGHRLRVDAHTEIAEAAPENGDDVEVVLRCRWIEMGCCASSDLRDHPQRRGREGYQRHRRPLGRSRSS